MKILRLLALSAFLLQSFQVFCQNSASSYIYVQEAKFEQYINEVYSVNGKQARIDNPARFYALKKMLSERLFFFESSDVIDKAQPLLEVPLFNKYSPLLKRDELFNPATFNPLKYNLPFFTSQSSLYRIGSSNYYLMIKAQTKYTQN